MFLSIYIYLCEIFTTINQDFQGPFLVYSRTWQLEKSLKISFATLIEIGKNKHLGNNLWAGDNSSIISSLLKKNSRTFKDLIIFQGLTFQAWIFF
jgi:hypothetical protein